MTAVWKDSSWCSQNLVEEEEEGRGGGGGGGGDVAVCEERIKLVRTSSW